jgi:hypothetical protein
VEYEVIKMNNKTLIVGIDPQQDNISICVQSPQLELPISWSKILLKQRSSFSIAETWQKYIFEQSTLIAEELGRLKVKIVIIEQQRGRLNSIIEQTLLCCCLKVGLDVHTIHPRKWKMGLNFESGTTNHFQKKQSLELVKPLLEKFCIANNIPIPTGRLHDLCDAYLISKSHK